MSVQYRHNGWVAKARIRETRLDVYLGRYTTEEEARQAIRDWYHRRYGKEADKGSGLKTRPVPAPQDS